MAGRISELVRLGCPVNSYHVLSNTLDLLLQGCQQSHEYSRALAAEETIRGRPDACFDEYARSKSFHAFFIEIQIISSRVRITSAIPSAISLPILTATNHNLVQKCTQLRKSDHLTSKQVQQEPADVEACATIATLVRNDRLVASGYPSKCEFSGAQKFIEKIAVVADCVAVFCSRLCQSEQSLAM